MSMKQTKKPTCCKCGNYREAGHRWGVLERRKQNQSSLLKCLECGWKWWSFCNYVASLPDHVEYSRKGMTDQDILDRIMEGTLVVMPLTCEVHTYNQNLRKWNKSNIIERNSHGATYRFVEVCRGSKKKKIALHRLVWIFYHRQLVPEGYDVDHFEGNARENPDAIDNLRLLESSVNRARGKPVLSHTQEFEFEAVPF